MRNLLDECRRGLVALRAPLKSAVTLLAAATLWLSASEAHSQTINWGSVAYIDIVDSNGNFIPDDGSFRFELGAFNVGFNPMADNLGLWTQNWNIFDSSGYNEGTSLFSSDRDMELFGADSEGLGGISIPIPAPGETRSTFDFGGEPAYLWIKNSDLMRPGAGDEWLLVRADDWFFPTATGCCDKTLFEFSTSDFSDPNPLVTPIWGGQDSAQGDGYFTVQNTTGGSLQTYSLVPEPSSALIAFVIVLGTVMRRERGVVTKA